MKSLIFIIVFIISQPVLSSDLVLSDGNKKYVFFFDKSSMMIITKDCHEKCDAFKNLSSIKLQLQQPGGSNLGGIVCRDQLKGEIIILTDSDHDQTGVCRFKDQSMVALGTLQAISLNAK